MLLNLSNHSSTTWLSNQLECATQEFGMVIDMPFPSINPEWDFLLVSKLAVNYFEKIITIRFRLFPVYTIVSVVFARRRSRTRGNS
jgi:hypothetical protein